MKKLLTAEQMKVADQYTIQTIGVPSLVLMERAALACVTELKEYFDLKDTVVLCGSGNNGGDGVAIARILKEQHYQVELVFLGNEQRASEETKAQLSIARHYEVPIISAEKAISKIRAGEYTTVVDAMFGIGFQGAPRSPYAEVIREVNDAYRQSERNKVLAVDIPSGVHSNTGAIEQEAIHAHVTVTFGYEKLGHVLYPGRSAAGRVVVADIGIYVKDEEETVMYLEQADICTMLPERKADSNKGTYGKLLTIAGCDTMCGAAYLSGKAAYSMGCGLVQVFTDAANRSALQQMLPEAILTTYEQDAADKLQKAMQWATVLCIGPGLSTSETAKKLVRETFAQERLPIMADADGLNVLAMELSLLHNCKVPVIVTPHMGEMSRLTGIPIAKLKQNPIEAAKDFAKQYHCVCVLKDAATVIADEEGRCMVNTSGNNGMSTGGSGDVLSGMISGLLAQQMPPFEAAALGVYIHGLAGDLAACEKGVYGMMAGDLIEWLPVICE